MLVTLGQVSLSFYLMEFVYSKEYTTTLFWFNTLFYLNFRLELSAHPRLVSLFLPLFLFVCLIRQSPVSWCTIQRGSRGNIGRIYMVPADDQATTIPVSAPGERQGLFCLLFFCLFIKSIFIK